jgi:hypothetical protein
MRSVIALLRYCVIAFVGVILSSYAFAQQAVELEGVIARIPPARIIDWEGLFPEVNGTDGWQEQALSAGDEVCCPAGQTEDDSVLVALNRSADNLVRLSTGACITITEDTGSSADAVSQDSGESLFDLSLLEEDSTFTVETPTATVGASGTTFSVIVHDDNSDGDADPWSLALGDYTKVRVLEIAIPLSVEDKTKVSDPADPDFTESGISHLLNIDEELIIIEDEANTYPQLVSICMKLSNDHWRACKNACPKGKAGKDCRKVCKDDWEVWRENCKEDD